MKHYSKSAKRKAKKLAMPELAPTTPTAQRGNNRHIRTEEAADRAALIARCTAMGWKPTEENMRTARAVHLGDDAGRAIHIATEGEERRKLNELLFQWRKSHARFLGSVINRSLWSGKDSIPHVPEPFETREDTDYDFRTQEERADAARKAWHLFCEDLAILTEAQLRICHRGVWDIEPVGFVKVLEGKPRLTFDGMVFVQGLKAILKLSEGA